MIAPESVRRQPRQAYWETQNLNKYKLLIIGPNLHDAW